MTSFGLRAKLRTDGAGLNFILGGPKHSFFREKTHRTESVEVFSEH